MGGLDLSRSKQTLFLVDGSHYDRLRSVFGTPVDLSKLADLASAGDRISQSIYYRDSRDDAEAERQRGMFGWLEHHGFLVKGRRHERGEPRERYGTNLIEIAVDALLLAEPGDHVILVAGDGKLKPLIDELRRYEIKVTLVSTLDAADTIAPPVFLVESADAFLELANVIADVGVSRSEEPRPD
jgi:uncharacterized LabA/DUF88 family protein